MAGVGDGPALPRGLAVHGQRVGRQDPGFCVGHVHH